MKPLMEMTLQEFADLLASKEPAPGGGSTAALAGVLAASLIMMISNLSFGKKAFEELAPQEQDRFQADFARVQELKGELEALVEEDTKAFQQFMLALKLPKETESDKEIRSKALAAASRGALDVPLATARLCAELLRHLPLIAQLGNKNAVSDAGVGALLAMAGLKGAILNVKTNLPGIDDPQLQADTMAAVKELSQEAGLLKKEIMQLVEERL